MEQADGADRNLLSKMGIKLHAPNRCTFSTNDSDSENRGMHEIHKLHRRWVANYFGGKVKELHYHLTAIVDACAESLRLFSDGKPVSKGNSETVIYGFSSFANVIQTLKDSAEIVTGQKVPWSRIEQLRHGAFMRDARNASTHDGNPVVSAWVDGRYFVPIRILRLDPHGGLIEIPAPRQDVRTLCLEFSADFSNFLRETLRDGLSDTDLHGASFSMAELDEAFAEFVGMPGFAKQLFAERRSEIASQLANTHHDPVAQAIGHLEELIKYCDSIQER